MCDVKFVGEVEPRLFSSCSKLESLTLERCFSFESLRFDPHDCFEDAGGEELKWIGLIRVTNLTTFHFMGDDIDDVLKSSYLLDTSVS